MTHLIDKTALVAKIERLVNNQDSALDYEAALEDVRNFLDTIEVKEVDLEKEIKEVQRDYKTIEEYEGYPCTIYASDIEWIARHFFELGMQVSNKARDEQFKMLKLRDDLKELCANLLKLKETDELIDRLDEIQEKVNKMF